MSAASQSTRPARRWAIGIGGLLLLAFVFSVSFQVPATTRVTVTFAPRLPRDLRPYELRVTSSPRDPVHIIPSGGALSRFSWRPLFRYQLRTLAPVAMLPNGTVVEVTDPWLSAGAQRASEIALGLSGPGEGTSAIDLRIALRIALETSGAPRAHDAPGCPDDDKAQTVRPRRSSSRQPGQPVPLSADVTICQGRASAIAIDTAPLAFLVPDPSWNDAFARAGQLAYSNPLAPVVLDGSKMKPAGLDLPYTIEDELDGTPAPHPDQLEVSAQVIDGDSIVDAPMACRRWTTRLSKQCWRALTALPARDCASVWPVRLDPRARVLHIDFAGPHVASCKLLLGVVAPAGDDMHAMLFDLTRTSRPPLEP